MNTEVKQTNAEQCPGCAPEPGRHGYDCPRHGQGLTLADGTRIKIGSHASFHWSNGAGRQVGTVIGSPSPRCVKVLLGKDIVTVTLRKNRHGRTWAHLRANSYGRYGGVWAWNSRDTETMWARES